MKRMFSFVVALAFLFLPVHGKAQVFYFGHIQSPESGIWYDCWMCGAHGDSILRCEGGGWVDRTELPLEISSQLPCDDLLALAYNTGEDSPDNPDMEHATTEEPANAINGALVDSATDLQAGRLVWQRNYSSARTNGTSRLGLGWVDGFRWNLESPSTNGQGMALKCPDDSRIWLLWIPTESHGESTGRVPWTVSWTDGVYRVVTGPGASMDFDGEGRWVASRNNSGTETALAYDSNGRLVAVTDNLGDRLDFEYGAGDRIVRAGTQRASLYCTYAYDLVGRLTNAAIHASGRTFETSYTHDGAGRCVAVAKPDGSVSTHAFDALGRVTAVSPSEGFFFHTLDYKTNHWVESGYYDDDMWTVWIDTSHWVEEEHTVVAYRRDGGATNAYDYFFDWDKTRVTRIEGPDSETMQVSFSEDTLGLPIEEVWTTGANRSERMQWSYGLNMNVTQARHVFNGTATTRIEWDDEATLPVAVTDPAGFRTEMDWDALGRLTEVRDFPEEAVTNRTVFAYGADGLLASVTDGDGRTVRFRYDSAHNPTSVVDAAGVAFGQTWNNLGQLVSFGRRGSPAVSRTVDDLGRVQGILYPDGRSETFSYDALGRLTNAVGRDGSTTVFRPEAYGVPATLARAGAVVAADYDGRHDLRAIFDPLGRTAEAYGRDSRGFAVSITNLEGQVATIRYGTGSRPVSLRRFDGTTVTVGYDALGHPSFLLTPRARMDFKWLGNGLLSSVSNAAGTVSFQRDGRGAVTNAVSPAGSVAYRLTPAGFATNLSVAAAGLSAGTALDPAGRVTNIVFSVPGLEPLSFGFAWEADAHRLAAVSWPDGNGATFAWDVMDRPVSAFWTAGPSFSCAYSNDSIASIVREDGSSRSYSYDALGRLAAETASGSPGTAGSLPRSATYAWDLAGNRLAKSVGTEGSADVAYACEAGDRLSSWSATLRNGGTLLLPLAGESSEPVGADDRFGSLYIRAGTAPDTVPSVSGRHFWTGPLPFSAGAEVAVVSAIRDVAGNTSVGTNAVSAIAVTNALYGYTAAGCVSNMAFAGTGGWSRSVGIEWDDAYRPTNFSATVSCPGSVPATSTVAVSYDALGRILSVGEDGETFTRLHDGGMPFADFDATGGLRRVWLAAPGTDNWLGFVDFADSSPPAFYAYCTDLQGSVLAVADAAGAIVESYDYDAWGRILSIRGADGRPLARSAVGNRLFWKGREYFPGLGLYHFRARWYDPVTGRFLSKDPLGISAGLNLYAFCGGDPVNGNDPSGLDFWSRFGGFCQMVGGAAEAAAGGLFAFSTAETGIGFAGGVAVAAHGTDVAVSGFRKLWSGESTPCNDSFTSRGLQAAGMERGGPTSPMPVFPWSVPWASVWSRGRQPRPARQDARLRTRSPTAMPTRNTEGTGGSRVPTNWLRTSMES